MFVLQLGSWVTAPGQLHSRAGKTGQCRSTGGRRSVRHSPDDGGAGSTLPVPGPSGRPGVTAPTPTAPNGLGRPGFVGPRAVGPPFPGVIAPRPVAPTTPATPR